MVSLFFHHLSLIVGLLYFFVNETAHNSSGCSIDKSVLLIKSIAKQYAINFFNHLNILFIENNETKILSLSKFKNIISPDVIVFNILIKTKLDFETKWKIPVKETWLNRFVK